MKKLKRDKLYILIILCFGGCSDNSDQKLPDDIKREVFNRHCINCHSFINTKISEGGITYQLLNQISLDSSSYLFSKAKKNYFHQHVSIEALDSIIRH